MDRDLVRFAAGLGFWGVAFAGIHHGFDTGNWGFVGLSVIVMAAADLLLARPGWRALRARRRDEGDPRVASPPPGDLPRVGP